MTLDIGKMQKLFSLSTKYGSNNFLLLLTFRGYAQAGIYENGFFNFIEKFFKTRIFLFTGIARLLIAVVMWRFLILITNFKNIIEMKIRIYLDGEFNPKEHQLINSVDPLYINWENTLPIKGDYIDLHNFTDEIPEFVKEDGATWRVEHRTFNNDKMISLYLMFC